MLNKKALSSTAGGAGPNAWNVAYAALSGKYPIGYTKTGVLTDLYIKPDGTKVYIIDSTADAVTQFSLTTAWEIGTIVADNKSVSVSIEGTPQGVEFKSDGTKMYIVGTTADTVYQYSLSTAWDVSTASRDSTSLSIGAQQGTPVSLRFKSDGTRLYVLGGASDRVEYYNLSTAWDVSTGTHGGSFSVASQTALPEGLYFKPDGTKMYIVEGTNERVYQYSLSTAWDLTTASYDTKSFLVGNQDGDPRGLFFKDDGTRLYVLGNTYKSIFQYSLSIAWDVETAAIPSKGDGFIYIGAQSTGLQGLYFKPDGTKVYAVGTTNDRVYQYSLDPGWDLSTATYDNKSFSVASQDGSAQGVFFKPDGTRMYVCGATNNRVYQYSLSTAWDVSTASYGSVFISLSAQSATPYDLFFKDDGTKMYVVDATNDRILQYGLSTAWNVSTAVYDTVAASVATQETTPTGVFFKSDGTKMYVVGDAGEKVFQYSLSTAWNVGTASYDSISFDVTPPLRTGQGPTSVAFKSNGGSVFVSDNFYDMVFEFNIG